MPRYHSSNVGIDGQLRVDKSYNEQKYIRDPFCELCADILRQCIYDAKWLMDLLTAKKIYRSAKMNDRMLKLYRADDPIDFILDEKNFFYAMLWAERKFDPDPILEWAREFIDTNSYYRRIRQWRGVYAQWLSLGMSERTHNRLVITEAGFRLLPPNGKRRGRPMSG